MKFYFVSHENTPSMIFHYFRHCYVLFTVLICPTKPMIADETRKLDLYVLKIFKKKLLSTAFLSTL